MARNKIGLQFDGFEEMLDRLEAAEKDLKETAEAALKAGKQVVTDQLVRDTVRSNFPASGKYSVGTLKKSIDTDYQVKWEGTLASLNVGYDFAKSGMESIYLLYGTPRMPKAQKLYDDIYGGKVRRQVAKVQKESLQKLINRI